MAIESILPPSEISETEGNKIERSEEDRNILVMSGLKELRSIAGNMKKRFPSHVDVEDLESMGMMGLIQAAERFDPAKGVSFIAYAKNRINGAILDGVRMDDNVSRGTRRILREGEKLFSDTYKKNGEVLSEEQIAQSLGMEVADYRAKVAENMKQVVLNTRPGSEEEGSLDDLIHPDSEKSFKDLVTKDRIEKAFIDPRTNLTDREKDILKMHFYKEMPFEEIGRKIGISGPYAWSLFKGALNKLKEWFRKNG